jgi:hypothetical protein
MWQLYANFLFFKPFKDSQPLFVTKSWIFAKKKKYFGDLNKNVIYEDMPWKMDGWNTQGCTNYILVLLV